MSETRKLVVAISLSGSAVSFSLTVTRVKKGVDLIHYLNNSVSELNTRMKKLIVTEFMTKNNNEHKKKHKEGKVVSLNALEWSGFLIPFILNLCSNSGEVSCLTR